MFPNWLPTDNKPERRSVCSLSQQGRRIMDLISKPRSKSIVWMYFGLKADKKGRPLNSGEAICRLCRKIVLAKGGNTTNLRSHLRRRHRADFFEPASPANPAVLCETTGLDSNHEELFEDFPFLQNASTQNYVPDAVLPPGEPWLYGGPSRAVLSLPSCLCLSDDSGTGPSPLSSQDQVGELNVYAKCHLQQGVMFGPFVGEVRKGQMPNNLKYAWVIRDDTAFIYIDASDVNKSNWMRYVSYTNSEEEHNLIVFQFYRRIYYKVSQPISEGAELRVWIGKDYASLLGLGIGESVKCEVGDKDTILRPLQDIQLVTLPEPSNSSLWSDHSQSQNPIPFISDVMTMSIPDGSLDLGCAVPSSVLISSPSPSLHQFDKYDFLPGTEKLLSNPNVTENSPWYFFGFEPDPSGRLLDRSIVVCKLCGERMGCGRGTADLQSHLTTKHHIRSRETKDQTIGQRPLLPTGNMGTLPAQVTDAILNFLIMDLQPSVLVQGVGFKQLIHNLLPTKKELPSQFYLDSLLKEHHIKGKINLAQLLRRKRESREYEDVSDYMAPIEFEPARCGRTPSHHMDVPQFVTLSVDVWLHTWQGNPQRYLTLWAHYVDVNFHSQNLALSTQKLIDNEDCNFQAVVGQVKAMAKEWDISQPSLVLLGGEECNKNRLGPGKCEKAGEATGSNSHLHSTTFLERDDSASPEEPHDLDQSHSSDRLVPYVPCFINAVQCCIKEVMSHPVISETLNQFQGILSTLFLLPAQNRGLCQHQAQCLLQTMTKQEQLELKSWVHNEPTWNELYPLLSTLIRHKGLVCDIIKDLKKEMASESSSHAHCASSGSNPTLNSEWKVLEELSSVLKPLDVACRTLAKEAFPRLSLIKPILTGLLSRHLISRPGDSSSILKEVKRMMRRHLVSCYNNPVVNRVLCVACSLDPQFHGLGFMDKKEQATTFDWLKEEAVRIVKEDRRSRCNNKSHPIKRSPSPGSPESETELRRSKRLKVSQPINFREFDVSEHEESDADYSETAEPGSPGGLSGMEFLLGDLFCSVPKSKRSSVEESVDMEISFFRAEKGASLGLEPLQWWRTKASQFPLLATVAQAYLAAPAVAGNAVQDFLVEETGALYRKRANIPPENLDAILFLHHNHMACTESGQTVVGYDDKRIERFPLP